jgi:hypothetical protein
MVWIVALFAGWVGAFVLLLALSAAAARADRPTPDHLAARLRRAAPLWLPPAPERDRRRPLA